MKKPKPKMCKTWPRCACIVQGRAWDCDENNPAVMHMRHVQWQEHQSRLALRAIRVHTRVSLAPPPTGSGSERE